VRQDNSWYVEPARVFDDLYFVGDNAASAWALTTPDGIILFDTNYPFWLDDVVIAGMRKVGLDPARIKYVLVSHAHGDHLGGAQILQAKYGARIVMGAADWDLVAQYPQRYKNMSPRRDIAVTDSMPITLGGTTVRAVLTPGHTPGTLSFIFTVHDRGAPVTVAYAGGSGMNFPNAPASVGIPAYRTYAQSQLQAGQLAARAGATVLISNHPWVDNALARIKLLPLRGAGKHPFDIGTTGVQNFFRVAAGCARVAQLRLAQQAEK
jgi:metallo-beta-lactamase class B